jgi:succinate dehydrogenase/fumarate reductase flavoprotein subunit
MKKRKKVCSVCVILLVFMLVLIACPTEVETKYVEVEVDKSDWLGTAPNITDSQVGETKSADVVIVGAGISGLAAARAAREAGVSVTVIEQTTSFTVRGLCFGAINSTYQQNLASPQILSDTDKLELVRQMQKISGNRANMALWTKWVNESGAAFDWFVNALPLDFVDTTNPFFNAARPGYYLEMWPLPGAFNNATEYYPQFQSSICFGDGSLGDTHWARAVKAQYDKSVTDGVTYLFETTGKQLILNDTGAVVGVYAQKADGTYIRVNANKGVILATGDYGANEKMVKVLSPEFHEALANGVTSIATSTGEGHKMAIWAGARMEPAPHAHMSHAFAGGFGGIGNTVTLHLNTQGKRFMNEDVPGQIFTNQLIRQPGQTSWQIFDSTWTTKIYDQSVGHGNLDISNTFNTATTQAALAAQLTDQASPFGPLAANTLADLLAKMYPGDTATQNVALAEIQRYNTMCTQGRDDDFGVRPDRLFELATGPFYASRSMIAVGLTTAGVMVNEKLRVLKAEGMTPIPGLWAVGNVAGGRYSIDYPTTAPATSHGTAVTFGKAAGEDAAAYVRP